MTHHNGTQIATVQAVRYFHYKAARVCFCVCPQMEIWNGRHETLVVGDVVEEGFRVGVHGSGDGATGAERHGHRDVGPGRTEHPTVAVEPEVCEQKRRKQVDILLPNIFCNRKL